MLVVLLAGCPGTDGVIDPPPPGQLTIDQELRQHFGQWGVMPIGAVPAQDPALVALGQALVFDKVLSGNRDISCATCHDPSANMADGLALSIGTGGTGHGASRTLGAGREFVPRSAPTLINQGLGHYQLFWDGRVAGPRGGPFTSPAGGALPGNLPTTLAAQAMFPVTNRAEMRGNPGDVDVFGNANELAAIPDENFGQIWAATMARLTAIPQYVTMFQAAFPGTAVNQLTFRHAAVAIASFITGPLSLADSPFDRYLNRDDAALTTDEKRGGILFFTTGSCNQCHSGALLGGQQFANVGAPQVGPGMGIGAPLDFGKGGVDDDPFDPPQDFYRFQFRVPSLRNVELTAPYFHSGAYPTLEAVVAHYNDVSFAARNYDVTQLPPALRASFHGGATVDSVLGRLDFRLQQPLGLTDVEQRQIVAFLKSMTDPRARNLAGVRPASVPSGLSVE